MKRRLRGDATVIQKKKKKSTEHVINFWVTQSQPAALKPAMFSAGKEIFC